MGIKGALSFFSKRAAQFIPAYQGCDFISIDPFLVPKRFYGFL